MRTAINFHQFPVGTKIESYDSHGYYAMNACGYIVQHLPEGNAVIKTFSGDYFSTVSQKIAEASVIN
jgi:hypothetical protein